MRIGLGIGLNRFRGGQAAGPANTVAPEVTGTAERGETLTCSTGTWTGTGTITYAYQWRRNGSPIAGATNSTYTPVADDDNTNLACIVSATDDEGTRSASSNTVGPVLGAPFLLAAPVLSGTEQVNQTLSVTNGTWQGVATITFGYQWRRNGVDIPGATGATYTLVAADFGAIIDRVETATNSLDSATSDSNDTGAIAGLAPTNDTAPSIAGDTGLGDTLTRTAGSWSGVPTPSVSGQWRRNGVAIAGETGATYTIVAADSGADIDYLETATNAEGSASADSNDITVQTFTAPTNDVAPSITGNDPATIDDVLTRVEGTWSGNPTPTLAGEWYRNNVGTGETGSTYTITAADDNSFIFYRETATNAIGSASEDSAAVTVEDFTVPAITGSPTIAGTEEVGETLTATAASATGNPSPVTTWQWQRSADGTSGWANISGATSATYTLVAADEANYIRVQQIETNALGSDTAVSVATGEIASGATGLLDSYTGAAAAFSLDTLIYGDHTVTDTKTGSDTNGDTGAFTVLVRRDTTPNAWRSFTPTEVSDGTLTTWVGAGYNGFVETWYNQGSAGDAVQTTTASQPKIVDNGSLVVENGKAALNLLDNSATTNQQHLAMPFIFGAADTYSAIVSVFTLKGSGNFTTILGSDPADKGFISLFNTSTRIPRIATIRTDIAAQNATNPIQLNTPTLRVDAANRVRVITRIDANEVINITDNNQNYQTATETLIGNNVYDIITANINFQTLVIYTGNTDRASQIPDIETALNDYYSIY